MKTVSPIKGMSVEDLRFIIEAIGIPAVDKEFWSNLTSTQKLKRLADRSTELDVTTMKKTRFFQLTEGAFLVIPGDDARQQTISPWDAPLPAVQLCINGNGIKLTRSIKLPPEGEVAWCVDESEGYSSEEDEIEARLKLVEVYVRVMELIKERIQKQ